MRSGGSGRSFRDRTRSRTTKRLVLQKLHLHLKSRCPRPLHRQFKNLLQQREMILGTETGGNGPTLHPNAILYQLPSSHRRSLLTRLELVSFHQNQLFTLPQVESVSRRRTRLQYHLFDGFTTILIMQSSRNLLNRLRRLPLVHVDQLILIR